MRTEDTKEKKYKKGEDDYYLNKEINLSENAIKVLERTKRYVYKSCQEYCVC